LALPNPGGSKHLLPAQGTDIAGVFALWTPRDTC
jgi:hypothetical protein